MIALFSKKKNHYAILYKHPNPLFSFIQTLTFLCLVKVVTCRFNIRFQLFIPLGVLEYVTSLSAYIFHRRVFFFWWQNDHKTTLFWYRLKAVKKMPPNKKSIAGETSKRKQTFQIKNLKFKLKIIRRYILCRESRGELTKQKTWYILYFSKIRVFFFIKKFENQIAFF